VQNWVITKSFPSKFLIFLISNILAVDKNGSAKQWLTTYAGFLCLIVSFFGAGVYVGSLIVESDASFSSSMSRNMLTSVSAASISSYVNVKGKHLRKVEEEYKEEEEEQESASVSSEPNNPFSEPKLSSKSTSRSEDSSIHEKIYLRENPTSAIEHFTEQAARLEQIPRTPTTHTDKRYSLHAQEEGYLILPNNLDHQDLLISTWVYLDDTESNDNDMRTIFSNKEPGCEAHPEQYGISMFINAWQTNDHRLYVEYGGTESGCNKLDSANVLIDPLTWYHVAVYMNDQIAMLFINQQKVFERQNPPNRMISSRSLQVGKYALSASYTLFGNLSSIAVVHDLQTTSETDLLGIIKELADKTTVSKVNQGQVIAFYSLEDAAYEKPNSKALDMIHENHGKYIFSSYGSGVSGVNIPLIDGTQGREVTEAMRQESDRQGRERREKVKAGMQHAWRGYKTYAWGRDELKPKSNHGTDNWGGMGVTLVDSLDTLWVMGLKDEFNDAKKWVAASLSFDHAGQVSVFETTIRELGGLLAAYDLSGESVFLDKAKRLGDRLIKAFQTSSGIPSGQVNLNNGMIGNGWAGNSAILSELGTLQVEFRYLAYATGESRYEDICMKPVQMMAKKNPPFGLYPIKIRIDDGNFADNVVTFGALGDSFYEYLLKLWIQGGRKEMWLRETYDRAMNGAIAKLLQASTPTGLAFFGDWSGNHIHRKMDHLVCFVPGMLALGAYTDPLGFDSPRAQRDLSVAKAMMYTCREMYHRMTTGISAEYVEFPPGQDLVPGPQASFYILRPETAESLFILNQLTGDPIYRDWAWEIWEAIEKYCKTGTGYSSLHDVTRQNPGQEDRMESFFLAETMKYLYLAQDPDKPIDLMKYVFNTEAHPMKIFDTKKHKPVPL
jgi:flagellar motor protein MotB